MTKEQLEDLREDAKLIHRVIDELRGNGLHFNHPRIQKKLKELKRIQSILKRNL